MNLKSPGKGGRTPFAARGGGPHPRLFFALVAALHRATFEPRPEEPALSLSKGRGHVPWR